MLRHRALLVLTEPIRSAFLRRAYTTQRGSHVTRLFHAWKIVPARAESDSRLTLPFSFSHREYGRPALQKIVKTNDTPAVPEQCLKLAGVLSKSAKCLI